MNICKYCGYDGTPHHQAQLCAHCGREARIEELVEVFRRCLPLLIAAIREYDDRPLGSTLR
jgi:uncharacterized paraquat-inducible protein A